MTAPYLAFMAGGGRRQWTMVVMGVGGGIDLFHLFITLLLLALLYFIVGEAWEICEHFQELSTKSSRKSCLSCYLTRSIVVHSILTFSNKHSLINNVF